MPNLILNKKALLLVQLQRFDQAEPLFKQAIDLLEAGAGGDTWALRLSRRSGRFDGAGTPGRSGEAREASHRHRQEDLGPDPAPPFSRMAILPPPPQQI